MDDTNKGLTSVELQEIYTETSAALISFYRQSKIKGWMEKPFSDFSKLTRLCGAQCLAFFNNNGLMSDLVGHVKIAHIDQPLSPQNHVGKVVLQV